LNSATVEYKWERALIGHCTCSYD